MQLPIIEQPTQPLRFDFNAKIADHALTLPPLSIETLQLNVGKLCNQACRHCHVDASPIRTEMMDRRTAERVIEILAAHPQITTLDITGGAPELNPNFEFLVREARRLDRHVMVRHNLTVQFDGHPQKDGGMEGLPAFFAQYRCEVVSSLPYYSQYFTDKQRGRGVFEKSVEALRRLNSVGYGIPESGLMLHLVYNPVGAFLPAAQGGLEVDYKRELQQKFGVRFNNLYTITNMPIHRFKEDLLRHNGYNEYMTKLTNAFNPAAALGVMCRTMISVDYDGRLSDCDFNQMLDLPLAGSASRTIFDWNFEILMGRQIVFADHCFGCTAGAGSSCGGTVA